MLVTAAAGAVGTAALQIVRALNGAAVAAVGSEEKLALCRELGAVEAVTYDGLGELDQVDAVFDLVGGEIFAQSLTLLKPMGTAIAVGYAGGVWQDVSPTWLVGRNIGIHGFFLGRLLGRDPGAASSRRRRTCSGSGRAKSSGRSSGQSSRWKRPARRTV